MKLSEVKELLPALTKDYFTQATVIIANQSFAVTPENPLVTLSFGTVQRATNPTVEITGGTPVSYYPASVSVQVDLYTQGRTIENVKGKSVKVEDSSTDDLLGFFDFLNSPYAIAWCDRHDIAVLVPEQVQNLTGIVSDTNYQFRSMAELTVNFTMVSVGYTGTLSKDSIKGQTVTPAIEITPSGGGNAKHISEEESWFEDVEIKEEQ